MKVLVYGEQFHIPAYYRRWELFAQSFSDVNLTLLTPSKIRRDNKKSFCFGEEVTVGKEVNEQRFAIRLIERKNRFFGWTSPNFKNIIEELQPDIFYVSGGHYALHLYQVLHLRKKYFPKMKVVAFSMRGPAYNIEMWKQPVKPFISYLKRRFGFYYYVKHVIKYFNKNCDAVFCHYPCAVECFKQEGYNGPIYMQTQVGVNPEVFHEDLASRKEIRDKYGLGDSYVFGSGTRFVVEKGVDDIIAALPEEGNWKYLIMGAGKPEEVERVKALVAKKNLPEKIIMTGEIGFGEMYKYWNSVDCVVHVPKSSVQWEETFSIALVQAMITGKPIIASNSGSVPYQVGPEGIIVPAGDINAIREKMIWVLNHQDEAKIIGQKMRERAYKCFSIQHLNAMLYDTFVEDVIPGKYDPRKHDMAAYVAKSELNEQ